MKKFFAFVSFISLSTTALTFDVKAETSRPDPPKAIRPAPPAPKFSESERHAELAARRARVLAEMKDNSIMILMSTAPKVYTNDVDFLYRQENNLYYLTALKQASATLVLVKAGGATQEFLFVPKRNPQFEAWNGHMYSTGEVAALSGIKNIVEASEYAEFFNSLKNKQAFTSKTGGVSFTPAAENLYLLIPQTRRGTGDTREYQREWDLAKTLANVTFDENSGAAKYEKTGSYQLVSAHPIFAKLRSIKSPYELKIMQHAIDISTEAHMRAMATVKQVKWEYETQAEIEYVFKRRNADYWGYPSIVGCGPNATTLHYVESQSEVKPGNLFLIDVGAEYDHYTADITRTFPVNGKFSKEQAEIYQIVYDAQEAAAKATKPGATFAEISKAADDVVQQGLAKLGLITAPGATYEFKFQDRVVQRSQSSIWFMHGLGHWLGMNVHDVGDYSVPLKAGMIYTNEPGVYLREDALDYIQDTPANKEFLAKVRPAYEKYKTIGVRIEDDMLVTETGVEWMSKNLPRKMDEIEYFMAKSAGSIRIGALEKPLAPTLAFSDGRVNLLEAAFDPAAVLGHEHAGRTVRAGWTFAGKNAAYSSLHHDHAE